jgi:ParB family chromosome partitioning protein
MSDKLKTIPLCQLKRATSNVRKTDRFADIKQLAASIEANGLLENLVVQPANDDLYDVTAGGRRLAALKHLAKRGRIAKDHPVACLVKPRDKTQALEVSLAENFERAPLHPADQFEAFARLAGQGLSAAEIGVRFGVTSKFVEQRLKLASVSPSLIAEYRNGAMTLEQLTAFTIMDDQTLQEQVWSEHPYATLPPETIRRLLTKMQVHAMDGRARFIGIKAYEAAGGSIVRDLFDSEDEGYFADSQLLDRLVAEKLESAEQTVRAEGWQWVEVLAETDPAVMARLGQAESEEVLLSEEEETSLSTLGERYDELVAALEEGDDSGLSAELDKVSAEMEQLLAKKTVWPDVEKARAGAIVTIDHDGRLLISRGLLKKEAMLQASRDAKQTEKKEGQGNGYAERVLLDLSAHRTAALREVLASQPQTALLALLHGLVDQLFYAGPSSSCLTIRVNEVHLDRASASVAESKAAKAFAGRHQAWSGRVPENEGELWTWLAGLGESERADLLAICVAMTVNGLRETGHAGNEAASALLAKAVSLDMTAWWQPTAADFFEKLTKAEILAAVSEGVSQLAASRIADLKKDRMAEKAETLLNEAGWLPAYFRNSMPEPAGQSGET